MAGTLTEDSYERGAVDALVLVLEQSARVDGVGSAKAVPFEPGSLAARLLLEIASGVHGTNADLAERLATDETQICRAGRRIRELGLADRSREGRLNRWSISREGERVVSVLRS